MGLVGDERLLLLSGVFGPLAGQLRSPGVAKGDPSRVDAGHPVRAVEPVQARDVGSPVPTVRNLAAVPERLHQRVKEEADGTGPHADAGVRVAGAFDTDRATCMLPAAQRVAGVLASVRPSPVGRR